MIGRTLSHYRIVVKLGSGGMGDVYLAEDTKLDRKVALKVLPSAVADDEERRARFQREAKAIAALDHPNIVQVFSVEEAEGTHFITMQLVQGKTLSELIRKKGMALEEFFDIAIPLADAVSAAHEAGIVHRDLKPANAMVTHNGLVKVLDFGLAHTEPPVQIEADSESPTAIKTREGVIAGTLHYMSPEQAEGRSVDHRTDVFSLGVIFYEMLTGVLPFDGETPAATLSAILTHTLPSISAVEPSVPRELARIVKRCLVKDPDRRIQTAKDVRNELEDVRVALASGELVTPVVAVKRRPAYGRWAAALVAGVAAVAIGASLLGTGGDVSGVVRVANPVQITSALGVEGEPTWSPDGGRIAYVSDQTGNLDIWVTQIGGGEPVNLTADDDGRDVGPAWSPDGTQIAFKSDRAGGGCYVVSALGGTARRLGSMLGGLSGGPAWSPDGSKLACPELDADSRAFLEIVDLPSGQTRRLTLPGQYPSWELSWSPDGRFFAFVEAINVQSADTSTLWLVRSADGEATALTDGTYEAWSPAWMPDGSALLYVSRRSGPSDLWLQSLHGDAQPIGEPRALTTGLGIRHIALTSDGKKLAYAKGGRFSNAWRVPIRSDRAATWSDAEQLTFDQAFIEFLDVTRDGKRLVVNSNRAGNPDLWTLPADGGAMQPLTSGPAADWSPSWSPDGKSVAFYSNRSGNRDIFTISAEGGPARQLTTHTGGDVLPSWSPDGSRIAYTSIRNGNYDVWVMDADGNNQRRLTESGDPDNEASWSPDSQSIVYAIWEANAPAKALRRIPADGGESRQLTSVLGSYPRWAPNGEAIYFRRGGVTSRELWAVSPDGSGERLVADFSEKRGSLGEHSLATDGDYLYFTWDERLGDLWIMDVVTDEDE